MLTSHCASRLPRDFQRTHKHTDTPTFALTKMLANIKKDHTLANILAFAIKANLRAFCWREKLILKITYQTGYVRGNNSSRSKV